MHSEAHQTGTLGPRKGAGKMIRVPKTLPLVQKVQLCGDFVRHVCSWPICAKIQCPPSSLCGKCHGRTPRSSPRQLHGLPT